MTQEEFFDKYDQVIIQLWPLDYKNVIQIIKHNNWAFTYKGGPPSSITLQLREEPDVVKAFIRYSSTEFLSDYANYTSSLYKEKEEIDERENQEIFNTLSHLSIESETVSKVVCTFEDARANGFIQSLTTQEVSLWWKPNGERLIFVCGKGCYKLSNLN